MAYLEDIRTASNAMRSLVVNAGLCVDLTKEPIERCPDVRLGLLDGIWFDGALGTNYALGTQFGGRASTLRDRSLQADRDIPR